MRIPCFIDFHHGISVFANFSCSTPQYPSPERIHDEEIFFLSIFLDMQVCIFVWQ